MTYLTQTRPTRIRSEVEIARLRAKIHQELGQLLGDRWVSTDPGILDTYAWQYLAEVATGEPYMPRPLAVVLPANTEEVAAVVRFCNREGIQYKAISTGMGMWGAPHVPDQVIQIDLRRMNRILELDARNMYAVVEPYVTGNQLQTEAMKVGLNTHIAGCGAQCSVLASATSVMGQGMDGSFSNRNLLGFEWVTPDGRIVQVGSFDADKRYFAGDGPGFSIRGIIRGFAGAFGGLGVFTRAAVQLFPWDGPEQLNVSGRSPRYYVDIPRHHTAGVVVVRDWKGMAELGRELSAAGIASHITRNAPAILGGSLADDNEEAAKIYRIPLVHELYYALTVVVPAASADEARYRRRVLHEITRRLGGGALTNDLSWRGIRSTLAFLRVMARTIGWRKLARSIPGFLGLIARDVRRFGWRRGIVGMPALVYQALVRAGDNIRGIFRFAGTFWTAMGALATWDTAIHGAKIGAQIKRKYIARGAIMDDGGDNAWGGLYEDGLYAHLEELTMYDQRKPQIGEAILEYVVETNLACIEHRCGDSLNAVGPANHFIYSPACFDYDRYTQRIKAAFDPNDASDANVYTDPGFEPSVAMQQVIARVASERASIVDDLSHIPERYRTPGIDE